MLEKLKQELSDAADPERAKNSERYFKTGKGQYGEGDVFIGISNPKIRELSKKYDLSFKELQELLNSKIHEERLIALLILIRNKNKEGAFRFYLANTRNINNWDLVDLSASKIVGEFLKDKERDILYDLARSDNLWEKRISIISTFAFIKDGDFDDALAIAEMLLGDNHDLIHKAVGWVLREIGKKDQKVLEKFLKKHYSDIPRTTLRYAIERFEEGKRKKFLEGKF
jgi:3-methyladenine DNA glycosylase AlkD